MFENLNNEGEMHISNTLPEHYNIYCTPLHDDLLRNMIFVVNIYTLSKLQLGIVLANTDL